MLFAEAFEYIATAKPPVVYVSGKTSTGKSTFAAALSEQAGYVVIELDTVVKEAVIQPLALTDEGGVFVEVYRNRTESDWITQFVAEGRKELAGYREQGRPVLVEGAL